ncbi:unnamed protein product [[Candida] boidinii]|nr:unnamed protein product [[Candida] boidinii]
MSLKLQSNLAPVVPTSQINTPVPTNIARSSKNSDQAEHWEIPTRSTRSTNSTARAENSSDSLQVNQYELLTQLNEDEEDLSYTEDQTNESNHDSGKISEFFLHVKVSDAHIIILTEFDLPYSPHFLHQLHDFLQLHHFKLATPSQKRVGILVRTDLDYLTIQETDKITTNSLSIPHVKRYMTDITIQFHHTPIIILAVYVPVYQSSTSNPDIPLSQSDFLDSLYSILPSVQFQDLILAGDWNTAPLELPSTMTDINLHSKLSSLNIDDIYPTSSPKNKKVNFTNYSTSSSRGHRRLDRTYISHPLQVKCNCFYKTYQKFHFSTHLPTSVTFYFNKNSHFVQEHSQTLPSLFPGKNYKYREKIIFTEFLQDAKLLEYLFQPTNINSQNPLITYNAYVKAVQKRNKRVFYLINRYIPSPSTSSDSQSLINLQQLNKQKLFE